MITIDGSQGEGGGQVLRTSLALSAVSGRPVRVENVRAGRKKPGLMRQHLTAARAAAAVCGGAVVGDAIGSTAVQLTPGPVSAGEYTFRIGTAGSTTLVLQTVLPALLLADGPSRLVLEGGTHNPLAPPFDFLQLAYLPLINRMGPAVCVRLERPGFFPAGGGRLVVDITPAPDRRLTPLHLPARGAVRRRHAVAVVADLSPTIARRELKVVRQRLGWSEDECELRECPAGQGPGNLVSLRVESETLTEVFTGVGTRDRAAEAVARGVADQCRRYLRSPAAVGEHLTDQLLLPLALAGGGSFHAQCLSRHTQTQIDLLRQFLDLEISIKPHPDRSATLTLGPVPT